MKIPSEGGWTFENSEIARAFDDHVREQLPWYDLATGLVAHLIRHYIPQNGILYDIGASTGNITKACATTIIDRKVEVIALEPSKEMRDIYIGLGKVLPDKAEEHEYKEFDVAVLFLTMMFVPIHSRQALLHSLLRNTKKGGCIIIFDKDEPASGYLATVLYRLTLAGKVATGVTPDEIIKKELSLSGCQRPYKCESSLAYEVFRFGDFTGWIIEVK
jgi:tRNA (cmo5U34)-methyltransferase